MRDDSPCKRAAPVTSAAQPLCETRSMKTKLLLLLTVVTLMVAVGGCSSSARVGTRNHGVSVGGSVR